MELIDCCGIYQFCISPLLQEKFYVLANKKNERVLVVPSGVSRISEKS